MINKFFTSIFVILVFNIHPLRGDDVQKWAVSYSSNVPLDSFASYSLVVLDSEYHPPLNWFIEKGIKTVGYISVGEVENHRPYFQEVKAENILLMENEHWKGSYFVDIRDPRWVKRVIEELIPSLLFQRFDGVFLDTIDNAEYLEQIDPKKFKGMKQAAINLIKAIRLHYPSLIIIQNRGYSLLPATGSTIDIVLAESIYTDYNFETKKYQKVPREEYQEQVELLQNAKKDSPHLQVFTLDYWNPNKPDAIKKIYNIERENGFIPYVSTIKLDKIIPEPH